MLVLVVLLLVIMPALLYLVGWGVRQLYRKAPSRAGVPLPRVEPGTAPGGELMATVKD